MSYIFETVTGSVGALSFKFNGQFALKNYNVEIVNGNRLRVVSTANEAFSLLEADVSEVEINGTIYSDPAAAQLALTSLVYSDAEPVVLTKEKYMQLAAAVQAADRGKINPATPVPSGGWLKGWYKPEINSDAPGTNYPNAGDMKAIKGFINHFYFDGVSWSSVPEIAGSNASQTFDPTDNSNPSTMKAVADWFNAGLGAFVEDDDLTEYASAVSNTNIGNQPATAYYILKVPFSEKKIIKEVNFNCAAAGSMTFVIGKLDQANKFILDRTFTVTVNAGGNTISVSELLNPGDYIGVKTPGLMPNVNTSLQHNFTWGIEGNYSDSLYQFTGWSLGLSFKVVSLIFTNDPLARKSDIDDLQEQINNFQPSNIWKSPDGKNWKVSINNAGQFNALQVGIYSKILHFGNSMLKHDIVSYWWGNWGMAAKTRADDYEHRFLTKIKIANPTAQTWSKNIAEWEQNPTGYNKTQLDSLLTAQPYDLIVVRLGENATSIPASTYKNEFRNLITYFQTKVPNARIIVGGMFWMNTALDTAMSEIAAEKSITFVSMAGLDISANKSFIGDVVQGDDGQSHAVNNAGVANHPNNAGMEAMAERLFNAANS